MPRRAESPPPLLSTLIAILIGTVSVLGGLWLLILAGWSLMLRLLDPALERSRDSLHVERIQRRSQEWERHRQALAQQRQSRLTRVVALDGRVLWLDPEQLAGFLQSCWAELELQEGCGWSKVRQQWRRCSLRWHPDQGGDPAVWLRKQRAYEALRSARRQPGLLRRPPPMPVVPILERSRRWPWPRRRI